MRIGEFAQKHGTTLDTIRHYLDMGLLVAEKKGGQYRFDEDDSWDFEKIVELKQFDFSLSEIQELLCYHRLAGDITIEYRNYYLSLLESKKEHFKQEIEKYKKMDTLINQRILKFQSSEEKPEKLGLPISSIEILQCPYCDCKMEIFNGIIEKNMIMTGNIKCECGFTAKIENGIYIDKNATKEKTLDGKRMPTKKEFLGMASPKFINFYYNGMAKLIDYITIYAQNPKYILELDTCVGSFLSQCIKDLPADSTYILVCYDLERLANIKVNIETQYNHCHFIFLCCDVNRLPIGSSSIDLIIDHSMTKEYLKTYNKSFANVLSPILKNNGLLVGTYHYFDSSSKDFRMIDSKLREIYNKRKNIENLRMAGFEEIETTELGPVMESNTYNSDIKGRDLYMTVYVGRKRSK